MRVSDFTYELPEELIAQHPPKERGNSRLLVLDKQTGKVNHKQYAGFAEYVQAGDVVVLNDTKVIKARLLAINFKGQPRELLLLEDHHNIDFTHRKALYRGKLHLGEQLDIKGTKVTVEAVLDGGIVEISSSQNLLDLAEHEGSVPLPPYMKREATKEDIERYQTVFARDPGSVAAPTASLNFAHELEDKLKSKGAKLVYLTLHVGLGTFLPIRSDDVEGHVMHSEYFEIPPETIVAIQQAKQANKRIFAIGTTVARTLEYSANEILPPESLGLSAVVGATKETQPAIQNSTVSEYRRSATPHSAKNAGRVGGSADKQASVAQRILAGEADIFIYPGYEFKVIDALLTNFHAPKTTVLMLAAAFAGWDNLKHAYEDAIKENYALLSYGDSMLIT